MVKVPNKSIIVLFYCAFLLTVSACEFIEPNEPQSGVQPSPVGMSSPPCTGASISQVELGNPLPGYSPPAEFTTSGSEIYITARRFEHQIQSLMGKGVTAIYVGNVATPPTYDVQRNVITNIYKKISVNEGTFGTMSLPQGRYWLWSSSGGDILIVSCLPNEVSNAKPQ
jgi:hypothetical protein